VRETRDPYRSVGVVSTLITGRFMVLVAVITGSFLLLQALVQSGPSLYDRLWKQAAPPVVSASTLERDLDKAGLVLSEVDIPSNRRWLRDDASMQALAQNILAVLESRRVTRPIPFDVVAGRYKELLGYPPAKTLDAEQYGDRAKIREAMLLAFNERGSKVRSFDEILEGAAAAR
jgi:hypothetical protein